MKKYLIALPVVLTVVCAPVQITAQVTAQVSKNKTGVGFSNYGTYAYVDVGPVQSRPAKGARKGATGTSDVPVFAARSPRVKLRKVSQQDAASYAMQLSGVNGTALHGVPISAGDVSGRLRIVRYDRHVFGVVDGLRTPMNGSRLNDQELGRSLAGQVARRTGCSIGGQPLMQFKPGFLNKLSVPLFC